MLSSDLVRWGGLAGMGAGVLFIVYSLLGVAVGNVDEPSPLDILAIFASVLLVVGLLGFHALQGRNYGRIGRAGLYTVIVGTLAGGLGTLVLVAGSAALAWLVFPVGALALLVGFVLYGAATLQARVLPRWCGILFIILMPGTILFGTLLSSVYPSLWYGLVWVALGYALWSQGSSGAAAEQPSRVS